MPSDKSVLQKQKFRALGLPADSPSAGSSKPAKLSFKVYFPQPPYRGAKYAAALSKADRLFNFVGLVLGHHGKTIQRIQKASGARVEVHDGGGNLNGEHPAHDDPSLHALVLADSRPKLDKAVGLLLEVVPGGSVHLRPVIPPDWPEADEEAAAPASPQALPPTAQQPPNAWAARRPPLTKQRSNVQPASVAAPASKSAPASPLARAGGEAGAAFAAAAAAATYTPPPQRRSAPLLKDQGDFSPAVVHYISSPTEATTPGTHDTYTRSDSQGSSASGRSGGGPEACARPASGFSAWEAIAGPAGDGGAGGAFSAARSPSSSFYDELAEAASASFPGLSPTRSASFPLSSAAAYGPLLSPTASVGTPSASAGSYSLLSPLSSAHSAGSILSAGSSGLPGLSAGGSGLSAGGSGHAAYYTAQTLSPRVLGGGATAVAGAPGYSGAQSAPASPLQLHQLHQLHQQQLLQQQIELQQQHLMAEAAPLPQPVMPAPFPGLGSLAAALASPPRQPYAGRQGPAQLASPLAPGPLAPGSPAHLQLLDQLQQQQQQLADLEQQLCSGLLQHFSGCMLSVAGERGAP
eukprot:scaffold3.g6375.t1